MYYVCITCVDVPHNTSLADVLRRRRRPTLEHMLVSLCEFHIVFHSLNVIGFLWMPVRALYAVAYVCYVILYNT